MRKYVYTIFLLFFIVNFFPVLAFSQSQAGESPPRVGPVGMRCTYSVKCNYQEYITANCTPPQECWIVQGTPTCLNHTYESCEFYLPAPRIFPDPPKAGVQTLVYVAIGHDTGAPGYNQEIIKATPDYPPGNTVLYYRYQLYITEERKYEDAVGGCSGGCHQGVCSGICSGEVCCGWRGCGGYACAVDLAKMYKKCGEGNTTCDPVGCTPGDLVLADIDALTNGCQYAPEMSYITHNVKKYMFVGIIPPLRSATKIQYWISTKDNADKEYEANLGGNWDNKQSLYGDPGYVTNAGSNISTEVGSFVTSGVPVAQDWYTVMLDPPDNRPSGLECRDYEYEHLSDSHHPYPDYANVSDAEDGLKYDGCACEGGGGNLVDCACSSPGAIPVKYEDYHVGCETKKGNCNTIINGKKMCSKIIVKRFPCNPKANGEGKINPCSNLSATGCHRMGGCHSGRNTAPDYNDLVNNKSMDCDFAPPGEAGCPIKNQCPNDGSPGAGKCCSNCAAAETCRPDCDDGFLPDHKPYEGVCHIASNASGLDYREGYVAFDKKYTHFKLKTQGMPEQLGQEMNAGAGPTACDIVNLLHGLIHNETFFMNIWIFRIVNPDFDDGWVLYIPAAQNLLNGIKNILGGGWDVILGDCEVQKESPDDGDHCCWGELACAACKLILSDFACHIASCHWDDIQSLAASLSGGEKPCNPPCKEGEVCKNGECCPGTTTSAMTLLEAFTNSKTHLVGDIMDLLVLLSPESGGGQSDSDNNERIQKTFAPVGDPSLDPVNNELFYTFDRGHFTWTSKIGPNPSMHYRITYDNLVIGLQKTKPYLVTFAGNIDTTNYGLVFRKQPRWVSIVQDQVAPQLEPSKINFTATTLSGPPSPQVRLSWKTPLLDNNLGSPTYGKLIYSDNSVVKNTNGDEIAGHPSHNWTRTYSGYKLDFNPATELAGPPNDIMGGFNIYRRYYDPIKKRWSGWRLLTEDCNGNWEYMYKIAGDPNDNNNWESAVYDSSIGGDYDATYPYVDSRPHRYKRQSQDLINKNLVDNLGHCKLLYYVDSNGNKKRDNSNPAEYWKNDKSAVITLVGDTFTFTDVGTGSGDPHYDLIGGFTYAYKLVPVDKPNLFCKHQNGFIQFDGMQQNNNSDGGNEFYRIERFKDPLAPENTNANPKDDISHNWPTVHLSDYYPPYNEGPGIVAYAGIPDGLNAPTPPPTYRTCGKKETCDINGDGKTNLQDFNLLVNDFNSTPGSPNWNNGRSDLNDDGVVDLKDYGILLHDMGEAR